MDQDFFAKELYFAELGRLGSEAMAGKVSAGLPSGRIPLGYLASANKAGIERDMEKAPSIIEAFELAAEGVPLRKILSSDKAPSSRSGRPLSPSSLYAILTNPFYYGFIRYRSQLHSGSHEPLVSGELFAYVQQWLRAKRCKEKVQSL